MFRNFSHGSLGINTLVIYTKIENRLLSEGDIENTMSTFSIGESPFIPTLIEK